MNEKFPLGDNIDIHSLESLDLVLKFKDGGSVYTKLFDSSNKEVTTLNINFSPTFEPSDTDSYLYKLISEKVEIEIQYGDDNNR